MLTTVTAFKSTQSLLPIRSVFLPLGGRKFQGPENAHNQRPQKKAAKIHEISLAKENAQVKVSSTQTHHIPTTT